jgi:hypothetical protein
MSIAFPLPRFEHSAIQVWCEGLLDGAGTAVKRSGSI